GGGRAGAPGRGAQRGERAAVRADRQRGERGPFRGFGQQPAVGGAGQVPHLHALVDRGGDDLRPVRGEGQGGRLARAGEGGDGLAGRHVPDGDASVVVAKGDAPAVGAEGGRAAAAVQLERPGLLARRLAQAELGRRPAGRQVRDPGRAVGTDE